MISHDGLSPTATLLGTIIPATTYSPTHFRAQYNRPGRA